MRQKNSTRIHAERGQSLEKSVRNINYCGLQVHKSLNRIKLHQNGNMFEAFITLKQFRRRWNSARRIWSILVVGCNI